MAEEEEGGVGTEGGRDDGEVVLRGILTAGTGTRLR